MLPDQLTIADVQWLDAPEERPLRAEHADLAALHAALAEHPLVAGLDMTSVVAGQQQLANQLAYLLPLEPAQKLQLLQLDDPALRLEQLHAMLEVLQGDV